MFEWLNVLTFQRQCAQPSITPIQKPIKTCCSKSLNCYFETCFCSDKRTKNFTNIYFDGIGTLRLDNKEFSIPKELFYFPSFFTQSAYTLRTLQRKIESLPKDRLNRLLF